MTFFASLLWALLYVAHPAAAHHHFGMRPADSVGGGPANPPTVTATPTPAPPAGGSGFTVMDSVGGGPAGSGGTT